MKPACPNCHRTHGTDETMAVDRFQPMIPTTYRAAYPYSPPRTTRAQAEADMCAHRAMWAALQSREDP